MRSSFTRLSIVHVLAPARFGGLETVITSLAPAQIAAGDDVRVVLILNDREGGNHPVSIALSASGVPVHHIEVRGRDYRGERRQIGRLLDDAQPDLMHSHGYRPDVVDAPVARRRGIATVATVHGYTGGGWRNRLYERLHRRALAAFDNVVAVSHPLADRLVASGVSRSQVHILPNAWQPAGESLSREAARAELNMPKEGPVVGWVGRLTEEKGPDVFCRMAGLVAARRVHFSMIGAGPFASECERILREASLSAGYTMHGTVANAGLLLRGLDVLVMTSWTEGTPMLLLEAMEAGVPVISTAVGGIPQVVGSEEAILCEPGDWHGLAAAVDLVLREPDAARRRADAARVRVRSDFAVEPWASAYRELYLSALDSE